MFNDSLRYLNDRDHPIWGGLGHCQILEIVLSTVSACILERLGIRESQSAGQQLENIRIDSLPTWFSIIQNTVNNGINDAAAGCAQEGTSIVEPSQSRRTGRLCSAYVFQHKRYRFLSHALRILTADGPDSDRTGQHCESAVVYLLWRQTLCKLCVCYREFW